jgi:uncharacterized SAM-binding protein YcdF (DUF218 family)
MSKKAPLRGADLIVVFAGSSERIEPAYRLANSGYAPYLVISPASENLLKSYNNTYELSPKVKQITEDKARTTFENALYTNKIIESHGFDSVILVTSSYHLPRSYFLLRILLLTSKVDVQPYGVPGPQRNGTNWLHSSVERRKVFSEMVDFWGSLFELCLNLARLPCRAFPDKYE